MWTFLPASVILAAFVRRTRVSNILLLILSLLFYAWGDPGHILLLICVTAADYALGLLLGKHRTRGVLALSVVFNLGVLGVFKYADLLLSTLDRFVPGDLPRTGGTLPLGISFFTFSSRANSASPNSPARTLSAILQFSATISLEFIPERTQVTPGWSQSHRRPHSAGDQP